MCKYDEPMRPKRGKVEILGTAAPDAENNGKAKRRRHKELGIHKHAKKKYHPRGRPISKKKAKALKPFTKKQRKNASPR